MSNIVFLDPHKKQPLAPEHKNVRSIHAYAPDDFALPFYDSKVPAGFPSPADGHERERLKASSYLVRNETSTFYVEVEGDSMIEAKIFDGDVVVVDRSITPSVGQIVLAVVNGDFTIKYLAHDRLRPANPKFQDILFQEGMTVEVWGVVVGSMRKIRW